MRTLHEEEVFRSFAHIEIFMIYYVLIKFFLVYGMKFPASKYMY